ncbi:unnamed protein product [Notodromas monacha]|uniref:Uncharacterized protein n=1 Tax=Notodromas monacha TaxID=399045 RepID=A0A7R9GDQ8_9CRUS|nr:unnamed protein product [Notodromas monacha]CAG0918953.1 unnamed protein product [Notodromas monacha]
MATDLRWKDRVQVHQTPARAMTNNVDKLIDSSLNIGSEFLLQHATKWRGLESGLELATSDTFIRGPANCNDGRSERIGSMTAVIRVKLFIYWVAQEIQQWLHSVELAFVLHVQIIFHDTSESYCVLHLIKKHPPTGPNDHLVPVLRNHLQTLLNCINIIFLNSSQYPVQSSVRLKNLARAMAFIRTVESPMKKNRLLSLFANLRLRHDPDSICGKILSLQCGNSHLRSLFTVPLL